MFILIKDGIPVECSHIKSRAIMLAGQRNARLFECGTAGCEEIKIEPLLFKLITWYKGDKTSKVICGNMGLNDTKAWLHNQYLPTLKYDKLIDQHDRIILQEGESVLTIKFVPTDWVENNG